MPIEDVGDLGLHASLNIDSPQPGSLQLYVNQFNGIENKYRLKESWEDAKEVEPWIR